MPFPSACLGTRRPTIAGHVSPVRQRECNRTQYQRRDCGRMGCLDELMGTIGYQI